MAVTVSNLVPAQSIPAAGLDAYVAPGAAVILDKVTVLNYSTVAGTFSAFIVPTGQSAGVSNTVVHNHTVLPGETYLCPELAGHVMATADTLRFGVSADLTFSVRASGRIVS